jgi:hypothetical protein
MEAIFALAMRDLFHGKLAPMKASFIALLSLLSVVASQAQEEMTKEMMMDGVRATPAAFETIKPSGLGTPTTFKVKLGESTSSYKDKLIFDGFRITVPADLEGRDFVWYFNVPENWSNWYVIPAEGEVEGGFRDWLNADKVYQGLDVAQEKGRMRVLQTLDGNYFTPGKDYVFWFRQEAAGGDAELRVVLNFATRPADDKKWEHENLEKVLKLKPASAAEQVKEHGSRGGTIMLDTALFDKRDAESRIDDVFFNLRQTQRMRGGFFITMEMSCPPCRMKPTLAKIREKYGAADFIQTAEEARKVHGKDDKSDEEAITTHFYDYFGFEIDPNDPEEKVMRVRTHANNFSKLQPPDADGFFGQVNMKNLTVFHLDKKEVGRLYFFLEGGKEPLCIQEPPVGKYRNDEDLMLDYQGGGRWALLTLDGDKVMRRIPFVEHRMEGLAEGFYENGSHSFKATYKAGNLHGEAIRYSEQGEITKRQRFRQGQPVDDEEKGSPKKGPSKAAEPKTAPKPL